MCIRDSINITTLASGINLTENPHFKVYPNPVNNVLYLESSLNEETVFVITDIPGKVVHKGSFMNRTLVEKTHIGPAGVYYVTLSGKTEKFTTRIIISE